MGSMDDKANRAKTLEFITTSAVTNLNLPLYEGGVKAGFPSPAEDFMEVTIDLNRELVQNPLSTFFCRVSGDSMEGIGIEDGDLLVVDKSLLPENDKVAVCYLDGEFTLKKIKVDKDCCWLMPANNNFKPIKVTSDNNFIVWGIVTFSVKSH